MRWLVAVVLLSLGCGPRLNKVGLFTAAEERQDRPLTLRIHVSGTYAAQPIGTHAHIREIVREADRVFASEVGAHLLIDEIVDGWKVDVAHTDDALKALVDEDSGAGVDVVVGMLGGVANQADHCNGRAHLGGKYAVVRTEDGTGDDRRLAVVVLLHEIGHALGASHDDEPGSIMNAPALPSSSSFGSASLQIIQSGLLRRGIGIARRPRTRVPDPPEAIARADRSTFERALDAEKRGDVEEAWRTAEGLYSAYPEVLVVQDLRCRLASARRVSWSEVRVECGPLMRLTMLGANPLE